MKSSSNSHISKETLYRSIALARDAINVDARTVSLAFSSEEPVQRHSYIEILDHQPQSVRLGRMRGGGPVLVDHNPADHVGVVEKVTIDSDGKGRAVVRFGKSARADEIFQDLVDGIRKHVSVGYRVFKEEVEGPDINNPTYRATDWEPLEISLTSIPADASVGVGRNEPINLNSGETNMETEQTRVDPAQQGRVLASERERVSELLEIGKAYAKYGGQDIANRAVQENRSAKWLCDELLRGMSNAPSPSAPDLGLSNQETQRYSVLRAIRAIADNRPQDAGLELDCDRTLKKKLGQEHRRGLLVPADIQRRDLSVASAGGGGYLVGTANLSFIDMLRNASRVLDLGATRMPGLTGNVTIPKQTVAATSYWVAEGAAITESQPTFGQLALTPKTAGALTEVTRQLLIQSDPSAENLIMTDLAKVVALAVDLAAINGSGATGQPLGVLQTSGIGTVTGTSLNWAGLLKFETDVATANAAGNNMAYLTTPAVRGLLKSRDKTGTTVGNYCWGGTTGEHIVNGYRADVTAQMPTGTMLFGDWSQIVIAEWGVLELLINPFGPNFNAGNVLIRAMWSVDVGVRQAAAFSAASSIT